FFFSSRRRHTRWPRDWSSDVCSSDLGTEGGRILFVNGPTRSDRPEIKADQQSMGTVQHGELPSGGPVGGLDQRRATSVRPDGIGPCEGETLAGSARGRHV